MICWLNTQDFNAGLHHESVSLESRGYQQTRDCLVIGNMYCSVFAQPEFRKTLPAALRVVSEIPSKCIGSDTVLAQRSPAAWPLHGLN